MVRTKTQTPHRTVSFLHRLGLNVTKGDEQGNECAARVAWTCHTLELGFGFTISPKRTFGAYEVALSHFGDFMRFPKPLVCQNLKHGNGVSTAAATVRCSIYWFSFALAQVVQLERWRLRFWFVDTAWSWSVRTTIRILVEFVLVKSIAGQKSFETMNLWLMNLLKHQTWLNLQPTPFPHPSFYLTVGCAGVTSRWSAGQLQRVANLLSGHTHRPRSWGLKRQPNMEFLWLTMLV